jgi:hypothetical protein
MNTTKKCLSALWITLSFTANAFASLPQIVEDSQNLMIEGCRVIREESGYDQLYVNGVFNGNFVLNDYYDAQRLAQSLQGNIYNGQCRYRSYSEQTYIRSLLNNPYLVQDFASYRYSNCSVSTYVDGWAHQLYVNGIFRGNYRANDSREMDNLQKTLVSHIVAGTCENHMGGGYNPIPPTPPIEPRPPNRCPDPNTVWDHHLGRCVSRATPPNYPAPRPRVYTCSIYGISAQSVSLSRAKQEVLTRCAAASRGYVCAGSQVSCY